MSSSELTLLVVDERSRTAQKVAGVGESKVGVDGTVWFASAVKVDPNSVSAGEVAGVS